jgi:hypothetical protein
VRPRPLPAVVRKGKPIVPSKQRPTSRSLGRSGLSAGKERSTNGTKTSPTQDRDSRSVPEACDAHPRSRGRPGEADGPPSSPQEGRGEEPDTGQATSQETCREAAGRTARTGAGPLNCRSGAPRGLYAATDASARADAARPLGSTCGTSSRGRGNGGRRRRGAAVAASAHFCYAPRRRHQYESGRRRFVPALTLSGRAATLSRQSRRAGRPGLSPAWSP